MQAWADILAKSAAALNDQAQTMYTNATLLPYLNMAMSELEEIFELNNIPATNLTSSIITVPAGTVLVTFLSSPPLPGNLIEIQNLYESGEGLNLWVPVVKREFLTNYILGGAEISNFGIWAWQNQAINVLPANVNIDLKLDFIQSLFTDLTIGEINEDNRIINTNTFFMYRTAALAAEYIGENPSRAVTLNGYAEGALERSLGISIKGKQYIAVRRRPFRYAFRRWRNS